MSFNALLLRIRTFFWFSIWRKRVVYSLGAASYSVCKPWVIYCSALWAAQQVGSRGQVISSLRNQLLVFAAHSLPLLMPLLSLSIFPLSSNRCKTFAGCLLYQSTFLFDQSNWWWNENFMYFGDIHVPMCIRSGGESCLGGIQFTKCGLFRSFPHNDTSAKILLYRLEATRVVLFLAGHIFIVPLHHKPRLY